MPAAMRRFAGHFFTLCSAVSLVLLVLACVLCIRTYNTARGVVFSARGQLWKVECRHARVELNNEPQRKLAQEARNDFEMKRRDEGALVNAAGEVLRKMTRPSKTGATTREYDRFVRLNAAWSDVKVVRVTAAQKLAATPYPPAYSRSFSLALPVLTLAILPALAARRLRKRYGRRRLGLCAACGYDLRASPERCPECGTLASAVTT
jgi:hypothetical protein